MYAKEAEKQSKPLQTKHPSIAFTFLTAKTTTPQTVAIEKKYSKGSGGYELRRRLSAGVVIGR